MSTSDLIERLRAAEGPDRDLDLEIESFFRTRPARIHLHRTPEHTASLDAALSLVSEKDVGGQQGYLREAMNELSKDHALHVRWWDESDGVYREKLARYVLIALLQAKEASDE